MIILTTKTPDTQQTCFLSVSGFRCFGVSHAWDEQQRSTSVKSKWVEPVGQSAPQSRQYTQHWHHAHTSLTQQVQTHTTSQLLLLFLSQTSSNLEFLLLSLQGDPADEQPQRAEPQPAGRGSDGSVGRDGRSGRGAGRRREEQQHGESQQVVTEHHRDAQTAASTATVHYQQVTSDRGLEILIYCVFKV